jgi:hypothetical protein
MDRMPRRFTSVANDDRPASMSSILALSRQCRV